MSEQNQHEQINQLKVEIFDILVQIDHHNIQIQNLAAQKQEKLKALSQLQELSRAAK